MSTAPTREPPVSVLSAQQQQPQHQRYCTQPHFKERNRHIQTLRWQNNQISSNLHSILFDDASNSSDQLDADQQLDHQFDLHWSPSSLLVAPSSFVRRVSVCTENQCLAGQQGLESRF